MRRATALIVLAIVALAAGGILFYLALVRQGPEQLRLICEQELSRALGTEVRVRRVEPILAPGLGLAFKDLEAFPTEEGPGLSTGLGRILIRPLPLLFGELRIDRLDLDGPQLRLVQEAGGLRPEGSPPGWKLPGSEPGIPEGIPPDPPDRITLRNGTLALAHASGAGGPVEATVDGSLKRLWLGRGFELEMRVALRRNQQSLGKVAIEGRRGRSEALQLRFEALELGVLGRFVKGLAVEGRASGELEWKPETDTQSLDVDATISDFAYAPTEAGPIELRNAQLKGQLRLRTGGPAQTLEIRDGRLRDGDLSIAGEARIALRDGIPRRLEQLHFAPLEAAMLARIPDRLPPTWRERASRFLDRLPHGEVTLLFDAEPDGTSSTVLSLRDAVVDLGETGELREVHAEASLRGSKLTLHAEPALLDGDPIPSLDVEIEGLEGLVRDGLGCPRPVAPPGLPGWPALRERLFPPEKPGEPPRVRRPHRVRAHAEWLAHPDLGCHIEDLTLEWRSDARGFALQIDHARYGGRAVRGTIQHTAGTQPTIEIVATVAPSRRESAVRPDPVWVRGDFATWGTRLGPLSSRTTQGRFGFEGSELTLYPIHAELDPAGQLGGTLRIDMEEPKPRYELRVHSTQLTVESLMASAELDPAATGSLVGVLGANGRIEPGVPLLDGAEGALSLHSRDGKLETDLPIVIAVAAASNGMRGIGKRATEYAALDLTGSFSDGRLRADLALAGRGLQGQSSGEVRLAAPYPIDAVLGLFFFRALDRVVGFVPLVNRMLLSDNRNFVGTYFAVSGGLGSPRAKLLRIRSIPGELEALPRSVVRGLTSIWAAIPGARDAAPAEVTPDPSS